MRVALARTVADTASLLAVSPASRRDLQTKPLSFTWECQWAFIWKKWGQWRCNVTLQLRFYSLPAWHLVIYFSIWYFILCTLPTRDSSLEYGHATSATRWFGSFLENWLTHVQLPAYLPHGTQRVQFILLLIVFRTPESPLFRNAFRRARTQKFHAIFTLMWHVKVSMKE
jgi:hypothetical protein